MVFLLVPLFRRVGASIEDAGRVSGANSWQVLQRITLPVLAPGILAIGVLMFVRSLEALEVELILGPQANIWVYSTLVYKYIRAATPDYGKATALGSLFLVLMLLLAFWYRKAIAGKDYTTITGKDYKPYPFALGPFRWVAFWLVIAWFALSLAAPLFFLVVGSFMRRYGFFDIPNTYTLAHWQAMLRDPVFMGSLTNSLIIATAVALGGALIYGVIAYMLVRSQLKTAPAIDALVWLPWAVPGVLAGLGMLWMFLATPARGLLYGTIFGIVVAMVIRDSPVTTQLLKAGIMQVGKELEESAKVSGATWLTMFTRIVIPLLLPAGLTVAVLNFSSAMRDISTPVLLYNNSSRPLSILMLEYSIAGDLERSSALATILLVVICAFSFLGQRLSRRYGRSH
jgi:iron(III) transport system permease protein